jgi:bis(5'-nucleosyl)-tetraphosphatase (symmetrical)
MSMGSIWMIGDVQGCCDSLNHLLEQPKIADDPNARFWFAGDLVNRGPRSLATLRRIMAMGDRALSVLGNHDLHLLAMAAGARRPSKRDTLTEVLEAHDAPEILNWLRHCPLAHFEYGHLLVHAGVLPEWSAEKTVALADEVHAQLRSDAWQQSLLTMYGNEPDYWDDAFRGPERMRAIINTLTRIRLCNKEGRMMLSVKTGPEVVQPGLTPWFNMPKRMTRDVTVVFGHWSTLGLTLKPDLISLDTGCVWGGQLSAVRLQDQFVVQIACDQSIDPLAD